jgi:hypothetical protein
MSERSKRILGWVCLTLSGIMLTGEAAVLTIPILAEIAHKSWGEHVTSISMDLALGALGLHLLRGKNGKTIVLRLVTFGIFLTPLLNVRLASKILEAYGPMRTVPGIRTVVIAVSLCAIAVPYVCGRSVVRHYERSGSVRPPTTPELVLYIVGLACAVFPSTIAAFSTMIGLPEGDAYYSAGLSYVMVTTWLVWWFHRYYKPARRQVFNQNAQ